MQTQRRPHDPNEAPTQADDFAYAQQAALRIASTMRSDPDEREELAQIGLIGVWEALRGAKQRITHRRAFLCTVMRNRMRNAVRQSSRLVRQDARDVELLDDLTDDDTAEKAREQRMFNEYFAQLEATLGRTARRVAENLVEVRTPAVCVSVLHEAHEKQRRRARSRKQAAARPRGGTKAVRVSGRMIREGLGLSPAQWARTLYEVREFTRRWLRANGTPVSD